MSDYDHILGLALFIGFMTFTIGGLSGQLPGLQDKFNTASEFQNIEREQEFNLSNYQYINSMNVTIGGAATETGNSIKWDGTTNARGEDYGYVAYNVTGLNDVFVRAEYISAFQTLFGSPIQAYDGSGNKITNLEGAPGSDNIDVTNISVLELRDYDISSGVIASANVPTSEPNTVSGFISVLSVSSSETWFQLLIGIPFGLLLTYIGIKVLPFIG